jgi:hypothetical protein
MVDEVFFVYVDRTLDERPFYVGKGKLHRVRVKERNAYWKNIVTKHGQRRAEAVRAYHERRRAIKAHGG